MWFSTFILKNVTRRPLRSLLTIAAIAIAIGSVVAFFGISDGFERSFLNLYAQADVDLIVSRGGGQNILGNTLPQELGDKIKTIKGVKYVLPGLDDNISVDNLSGVKVFGLVPETTVFARKKIQEGGRTLKRDDKNKIIIGTVLARNLGKGIGDTVETLESHFEIVGIYESNSVIENGGLIMLLHETQEGLGRKKEVTAFNIVLDDPNDPDEVRRIQRAIEDLAPSIKALPAREHVKAALQLRLAKGMAWLTSAIALIVGFFGVMNTMVMSVNERTREIGILRALGWRVGRVIRMVLLESVLLSILGALAGIVGAILIVGLLTQLPAVNDRIDGNIEPMIFVYGFLIAVGVGFLGGLVPATRAARMLPSQALHYE